MGDCIKRDGGWGWGWGVKMLVELNELKFLFNYEWGLISIENLMYFNIMYFKVKYIFLDIFFIIYSIEYWMLENFIFERFIIGVCFLNFMVF